MASKKLQLSEIKVKSFVTTVGKADQKTSKGGLFSISRHNRLDVKVDLGQVTSWTEYKTRLTSETSVKLSPGGDTNNGSSLF